jgi:hypothetical protein
MATTSVPSVPAPETQAVISPVARITGVFFSPKATFEDIVRKPNWILPIALQTLLSVLAVFAMSQRINWREFISQQIEKSPQAAQLSAEQKEQRIEAGAKFAAPITYAIVIVVPICAALVVGLVMWGAYNLLGGANTNFAASFAITAHAFLTGLVSGLLFILVLFLKPYGTVDLENPVATNIAAVLPDDAAKWLVTLCKSIDIFSFWTLVLLAIGFAATNPKKLKGGKAFSIAFTVWAVYVVLHTGWAFIFS